MECLYCNKSYKVKNKLEKHQLVCNKQPKPLVICEICGNNISKDQLERHVQQEKCYYTKCRLCECWIQKSQEFAHTLRDCPKIENLQNVITRLEDHIINLHGMIEELQRDVISLEESSHEHYNDGSI